VLLCTISAAVGAQTRPTTDSARAVCFNASPRATCRSFIVAEIALMGQLNHDGDLFAGSFRGPNVGKLDSYYVADLGWMRNRSDSTAVGGFLQTGGNGNDGFRFATEARYRRWLDHRFDVDVEGGPLVVTRDIGGPFARGAGVGVTTGVSIGYREYVALSAGYDIVHGDRTQSSLLLGARFGSWAVPVVVGVGVGLGVALAAALGRGN
jgi:hypothetical protein